MHTTTTTAMAMASRRSCKASGVCAMVRYMRDTYAIVVVLCFTSKLQLFSCSNAMYVHCKLPYRNFYAIYYSASRPVSHSPPSFA
jgi:hypothetical protein